MQQQLLLAFLAVEWLTRECTYYFLARARRKTLTFIELHKALPAYKIDQFTYCISLSFAKYGHSNVT